MPRRLLLLNALLGAISVACVVLIARELTAPMPLPTGRARATAAAQAEAREEAPRPPGAAYAVVATRNLFNPARSDAATGPAAGPALAAKPLLHGVVIRDGASVAYLEDPATKRTSGYRVGDAIAGGTLQAIKADGVVIARPDGPVDVRLRDPAKPRPAPAATAAAPAAPGTTATPALPQAPGAAQPPGDVGAAPQPVLPPGIIPGRRPLPPNLLRRVPLPDAPPQR
jgi:hypothetical protein